MTSETVADRAHTNRWPSVRRSGRTRRTRRVERQGRPDAHTNQLDIARHFHGKRNDPSSHATVSTYVQNGFYHAKMKSTLDGLSDATLFAAWRAGDRAAGDVLVRKHYTRVLRFFQYRTGPAADDLVQFTFAACTESLGRFREEGTFSAYLFGIARKQLLNFWRRRRSDEERSRLDAPEQPESCTWLSTIVARRAEQRILLQALVAMPEPLQTALVLFYWEGFPAREIGVALGCPTSTATTRLARAREVLREQVTELTRPGGTRDRLLGDIETWIQSLAEGRSH